MSRGPLAATAVGALTAAGGAAAAWGRSPVPVLVVGGLALAAMVIVAVVALAAVFSRDGDRATRAMDVLWMLLTAVLPSRATPIPAPRPAHATRPGRPNG